MKRNKSSKRESLLDNLLTKFQNIMRQLFLLIETSDFNFSKVDPTNELYSSLDAGNRRKQLLAQFINGFDRNSGEVLRNFSDGVAKSEYANSFDISELIDGHDFDF